MLRSRTVSLKCSAQVNQDLLDLRHDIVLAYYCPEVLTAS
jgi:hypothetical protein